MRAGGMRCNSVNKTSWKQKLTNNGQIFESIVNPKIQLNPWLDKLLETIGSERAEKSISMIRSLARIPDFIRHPALYLSEINSSYPRVKADCQTVRLRLAKTTELISSGKFDPSTMKMYAHSQTAYSFMLAMATILNSILRAFDPRGTSLAEDSASNVYEIITLAERASPFRPLAASYIPLLLTTGWAATDDVAIKAEIEKYFAEYQTDLADARWLEGAIWLKAQYGSWRRKSLMPVSDNPLNSCEAEATKPVNSSGNIR